MEIFNYATPRTIARGMEYYKNRRVLSYERSERFKYDSKVLGSGNSEYNVSFDISNIKESTCDCPYAKEHGVCKHIIAVYFHAFPQKVPEYMKQNPESTDVVNRMLGGETFDSLYRSGITKTLIKDTYRSLRSNVLIKHGWKLYQCRIERALIDLSKDYSYLREAKIEGFDGIFDYVVYKDDLPVLVIVYMGLEFLSVNGVAVGDDDEFAYAINAIGEKEAFCKKANIPLLKVDFIEIASGNFYSNVVRDALRDSNYAESHNFEREKDFWEEWFYDCTSCNDEYRMSAKMCGCLSCGLIFSVHAIVRCDQAEDLYCPVCDEPTVILDSQGFDITHGFMQKAKKLYGEYEK